MNAVEKYFSAEKTESLVFVVVGVTAIILASYFLFKTKQPFYTGMAYPLLAIALIQIVVGTSVYFRSPNDIIRVNQLVQTETGIQGEEIPRMEVVMKNFVLYRWIEIALIATGLLLFFVSPAMTLWKGVGSGLVVQAGFMLLLDYFAENRGKVYFEYLHQLVN